MDITISPAFSPVAALGGGALIGSSAIALMLTNGRIFGFSSIAGGTLSSSADMDWRLAFLAGVIGSSSVLINLYPAGFGAAPGSVGPVVLGAFLVGLGSRLGAGCTSGHGVCGLSSLRKRSFVAVGTFFVSAYASALMLRPRVETALAPLVPVMATAVPVPMFSTLVAGLAAMLLSRALSLQGGASFAARMYAFGIGALSATGLVVSGMANPNKVLGFFNFYPGASWDPSLALVMIPAIGLTMPGFAAIRSTKPLAASVQSWPTAQTVTANLVIGSALFGIGWGLCGGCPGPIIVGLASGLSNAVAAFAAMWCGFAAYEAIAPLVGPS